MLGIQLKYSCAFRLVRHKKLFSCVQSSFERGIFVQTIQNNPGIHDVFPDFSVQYGWKGPLKTCRLPDLRALSTGVILLKQFIIAPYRIPDSQTVAFTGLL